MFKPRTLILATIALLILAIASFFFFTTVQAQRIGHPPLNRYGPLNLTPMPTNANTGKWVVVDLKGNGVQTVELDNVLWTMTASCSGEGQLGVAIINSQDHLEMPVQKVTCDGKWHTIGTYSSSDRFTFHVVSHARSSEFIVTVKQ